MMIKLWVGVVAGTLALVGFLEVRWLTEWHQLHLAGERGLKDQPEALAWVPASDLQ